MSIRVVWDNEARTILRYDYGLRWSWEDFHAAEERMHAWLRATPHTVDLIANFEGGSAPPVGVFGHFKRAQEMAPSNLGMIVITATNLFIAALVRTYAEVYRPEGRGLMTASSLEDARRKIAELRAGTDAWDLRSQWPDGTQGIE